MLVQTLIVGLLVSGCFIYAAWRLMPQALRQVLAKAALILPWPAGLSETLKRLSVSSSACDCSACDGSASPLKNARVTEPGTHPLVFQKRRRP